MSKSNNFSGNIFLISIREWIRDRAAQNAAALAYYQFLTLGPLVGFIIFISDKIVGETNTRENVLPVLKSYFTPQFVKVITFLLADEKNLTPEDLLTMNLFAGLLLAWASKEYFTQEKHTIENTWNKKRDKATIKAMLARNRKALFITIVTIAIAVTFVLIRALLPHPFLNDASAVALIAQWIFEFLLFFSLFLFFFSYIPPVKVYWKNSVPAALLGAFLYVTGREIMKVHMMASPDMNVTESLVAVLLWLYYINFIFVYSAEFNRVYIVRKQNINFAELNFPV